MASGGLRVSNLKRTVEVTRQQGSASSGGLPANDLMSDSLWTSSNRAAEAVWTLRVIERMEFGTNGVGC